MVRPTDWKLFAEKGDSRKGWEYDIPDDYHGAACYIFGLRGKGERIIRTVRVGSTNHFNVRIKDHGYYDATTSERISKSTSNGYQVFVRYFKTKTLAEARRTEKKFLRQWWKYPWNKSGMPY